VKYSEIPLTFSVGEQQLLGIAAVPETPADRGVLIAVGGPQYRVGSHRQFLLLARRLAAAGYPVFRFDYRGMGDSEGPLRSFENVSEDIGAAIDAFQRSCPAIRHVVLWGLCDAASSLLMYCETARDARVDGLVLLNPWVRSEASLAQTHMKHYYGQRLLQREFWVKLLSGKMRVIHSVRELLSNAVLARQGSSSQSAKIAPFQERMANGLKSFRGKVLLILSGEDYTAREFIEYSSSHESWKGLIDSANVSRCDIPGADHTFSSAEWRARVEDETLKWLEHQA